MPCDLYFIGISFVAIYFPSVSSLCYQILGANGISPGLHFCRSGPCCFEVESLYETSMALVTFCFGSVFGMVMVRMPSSTLAEI